MPDKSIRATLAEECLDIITKDRNKTHGDPYTQLGMTAELWSTYLGFTVTREDVAACNILQKLSRNKCGAEFNLDDSRDAGGYSFILGEMGQRERGNFTVEQLQQMHQAFINDANAIEDMSPEQAKINGDLIRAQLTEDQIEMLISQQKVIDDGLIKIEEIPHVTLQPFTTSRINDANAIEYTVDPDIPSSEETT